MSRLLQDINMKNKSNPMEYNRQKSVVCWLICMNRQQESYTNTLILSSD